MEVNPIETGKAGILIEHNLRQAMSQLKLLLTSAYLLKTSTKIYTINREMLNAKLPEVKNAWVDSFSHETEQYERWRQLQTELGLIELGEIYKRGELIVGDSLITIHNPGGGVIVGHQQEDALVEYRLFRLTTKPNSFDLFPGQLVGVCAYDISTGQWDRPQSQMPKTTALSQAVVALPETIF